jgi:hypothetical protein
VVRVVDEWICERCGGTYDTEEVALDCGWWDWVHGIGADEAARAA